MIKNSFVVLLFLITPQTMFSQTLLKGKIISDAANLDGICVVNKSNNKISISEKGGYFAIDAKPTDTIMVSGTQVKGLQITLKPADFSENLFFIRLKQQITMLDEVYIRNYPEINAYTLGLIPFGTKTYTPAQRRLKTAGDFKSTDLLKIIAGGMQVDPIINALSGRTSMLKKELEVEKKEKIQATLANLYDETFFTKTLKIPAEYVKGFQIFICDNPRLLASIKTKNKTMTTFLLGELAENYKQVVFPKKE